MKINVNLKKNVCVKLVGKVVTYTVKLSNCVFFCVCQVMSKRLPQQQLSTLVFMLFEGLVDSQANCCRASSVILNTLLKNRGGGLQDLVKHTLLDANTALCCICWGPSLLRHPLCDTHTCCAGLPKTVLLSLVLSLSVLYGVYFRSQRCWRCYMCVCRTSQKSK